ncbi:MAG: hypothetical protein GXO19_04980 [Epsilonproteobacteria bacterium]|nr:hypothetical protein [Campylobacterota bacterium]NPA57071.1 hypothetical protein [Campylobacterota bacterium]
MIETKRIVCPSCGASMRYEKDRLVCDYCGSHRSLSLRISSIRYHPLEDHLPQWSDREFHCSSCGATFEAPSYLHSGECPYCSSHLIAPAQNGYELPYILPFTITQREAYQRLRQKIGSLWFAPDDFKRFFKKYKELKSYYYPAWVFSFRIRARYIGRRGVDYLYTETIYTSQGLRRVQRIRTEWFPVEGEVDLGFEDIYAFSYTDTPMMARRLLYRLGESVSFREEMLAGQESYEYNTSTRQGFVAAQAAVEGELRAAIRADIGGDRQIISKIYRHYYDGRYSGIYLPMFWGSVEYRGKIYEFFVNGQSGEVIGKRPYSWIKIVSAIVIGLAVVALILFLLDHFGYIDISMPNRLIY